MHRWKAINLSFLMVFSILLVVRILLTLQEWVGCPTMQRDWQKVKSIYSSILEMCEIILQKMQSWWKCMSCRLGRCWLDWHISSKYYVLQIASTVRKILCADLLVLRTHMLPMSRSLYQQQVKYGYIMGEQIRRIKELWSRFSWDLGHPLAGVVRCNRRRLPLAVESGKLPNFGCSLLLMLTHRTTLGCRGYN